MVGSSVFSSFLSQVLHLRGVKWNSWLCVSVGLLGGLLISHSLHLYVNSRKRKQRSCAILPGRMKLYIKNSFRSTCVLWAMDELGLCDQCDIIDDCPKKRASMNGSATADIADPMNLQLNSDGTSDPILVLPNGEMMFRADSICLYLAHVTGELQAPWDQMQHYFTWGMYAEMMDPWVNTLLVEKYLTRESRKNRELQRQMSTKVLQAVHDLNLHLSHRKYVAGNRFSMADVMVGYSILFTFFVNSGQLFVDMPNVQAYLNRIVQRPSFQATVGTQDHWREIVDTLNVN